MPGLKAFKIFESAPLYSLKVKNIAIP